MRGNQHRMKASSSIGNDFFSFSFASVRLPESLLGHDPLTYQTGFRSNFSRPSNIFDFPLSTQAPHWITDQFAKPELEFYDRFCWVLSLRFDYGALGVDVRHESPRKCRIPRKTEQPPPRSRKSLALLRLFHVFVRRERGNFYIGSFASGGFIASIAGGVL